MTNENTNPLADRRPSINPYLSAAGLVVKRIAWDLRPESWRSRSKIRAWSDKYKGEKAVILCNGPSLLKTDFSLLQDTFTFGLNKINLLFDKKDFRPSCIVAVNPFVLEQNADYYNETDISLFLDSFGMRYVSPRESISFMHSTAQHGFARDCSVSINQGYTVTYVAMQLAFHMGFTKVALVGCDHNFATKGNANETVVSGDKDESHFDPNYFAGGVKWQLPDLFESEVGYTRAKLMYECFDRKIVNSTEGGKLQVFERESLQQFLSEN